MERRAMKIKRGVNKKEKREREEKNIQEKLKKKTVEHLMRQEGKKNTKNFIS